MKEHTLLQAIARVNRLHEGKYFGYIINYVSIPGKLDQALPCMTLLMVLMQNKEHPMRKDYLTSNHFKSPIIWKLWFTSFLDKKSNHIEYIDDVWYQRILFMY